MGVFGLMGWGRTFGTAGSTFSQALQELMKMRFLEEQRLRELEKQQQFQREQAQNELAARLYTLLAQSGLQQLSQAPGYVSPEELQNVISGLTSSIGAGPGAMPQPLSELYGLAARAAKAKNEEERLKDFAEAVKRYAPNASPQAVRVAFAKFMNGEPGWVLDLGVSEAEANEIARNIQNEYQRALTKQAQATAALTEERATTERELRGLNKELLQGRIELLRKQGKLTDAQAKEIEALLPERLRRLKLDNDVLEKKPELLDLQIEAQRIENEIAKKTAPAEIEKAYAELARLDAQTALIAAQQKLTESQTRATDARTSLDLERAKDVALDRLYRLASVDPKAAQALYKENKDAYEKLGFTPDVAKAYFNTMQKKYDYADPQRKEALGVFSTYLDSDSAPPQEEWNQRLKWLGDMLRSAGVPDDVAVNLLAVLLDKWRGIASADELAWAKLEVERSKFDTEGMKLWLNYVKELNDNLNESRKDLMAKIDAVQSKYGDCIRLAGDPDFGFAFVQYSSDPTCKEKLEQARQEIEPVVRKLNAVNRLRNHISTQIAQRAGVDLTVPPEAFDLNDYIGKLFRAGVKDPLELARLAKAEAAARGYSIDASDEELAKAIAEKFGLTKQKPGRNTKLPKEVEDNPAYRMWYSGQTRED